MFQRLLIANRGEIACRIIKTCKRLGIETVAIASEADSHSLYVKKATYAEIIKNGLDSYLHQDKILEVAKRYQVDALHPGYGFLSENPDFSHKVKEQGIVFIGPSKQTMQWMADKKRAKDLAKQLNIPTIDGYLVQANHIQELAQQIGYPLLIKPTMGGGGKGMKKVNNVEELYAALESAKREALKAFSSDDVMFEKYLENPRHIEVQILGDKKGQVLALFDRDCSLQRRYQKIIEEAPAQLDETLRQKLYKSAIKIAKEVKYEGAGTIEFLVDSTSFYFLEMNTRLQVEHPVTEMILANLDLVEWQLRIAASEELPWKQEALTYKGHAIEARLYAEDPKNHFLPSIGVVKQFVLPESSDDLRLDIGLQEGDHITPYYDPMIGKIIAWGQDRPSALKRLQQSLSSIFIEGVITNLSFLQDLLAHKAIQDNQYHVTWIDQWLLTPDNELQEKVVKDVLLLAALFKRQSVIDSTYPWFKTYNWRLCQEFVQVEHFVILGCSYHIKITQKDNSLFYQDQKIQLVDLSFPAIKLFLGGKLLEGNVFAYSNGNIEVVYLNKRYYLQLPTFQESQEDPLLQGKMVAPMPGRITSIFVKSYQKVEEGTALLTLEAMKMEHTIRSPFKGIVQELFFKEGDFVEEGKEMIKLVK
ncbi:MAG: ATP-grasp domain-containing protein [Proteobacteria bacterium]|nr:ATP-grasp domain-containing protein [Pseudomonadota bacterium]